MNERSESLPLGIVVRRQPGVTRWARWIWRPVAVLPGAPAADWHEMRREGEAVEYHAATLALTVHRSDTEAYRVALENDPPSVYVVLRPATGTGRAYDVFAVTASPFEAQDYADAGEDLVEPVAMPPALAAWIEDFVARHHRETPFVKRRRDRVAIEQVEDGRGDPRIRQDADVYRSPSGKRKGRLH